MRSLLSLVVVLVASPASADPSESLDRVAIQEGLGKVRSKINACSTNATGTVKVKVEVAPSGIVKTVAVIETPAAGLGACVAAAIKIATFRATKLGGTFSYPIIFDNKGALAEQPDAIDRTAISEALAKVKPQILACGNASPKARGTVKLKVDVTPVGTVKTVVVLQTPDGALGDCMADAIKAATFRSTAQGGSFSYPFIFDGKAPTEPDSLERVAISDGIAKLKPQIMACGDASKARGRVKVKVEVAPSGAVSAATIKETPDKGLGDCVAEVLKQGTFQKTVKGGTFSYPFIF